MRRRWVVGLVAALVAAAVLGIASGAVSLSLGDVWRALGGTGDPTTVAIVRGVRLPRVVLALLVGAALGMSGAVLQGTLHNPLAEPYLLGISGGAAVGSVIAVVFGAGSVPLMSLAAFLGAIGAVVVVALVARAAAGHADPRVLLMAGVVVGAFANAAIMVLLANASADATRGALWWMMGSVASADWVHVRWLLVAMVVVGVPLVHWAREIDALALGDDAAAALGVRPELASRRLYLTASLLAAATVSVAGLVGFVGLVVPHLARMIAGSRHRAILGAAALAGGTLVVLADLLARTVRAPAELPLGAVTAVLGVPFFLSLLRKAA
jgi:iron complex transport system permease protein